MADEPGRRIALAEHALEPVQVALILVNALFETGPNKLRAEDKRLAVNTVVAGLASWKRQLDRFRADEVSKWKKLYEDTKTELDDVRLKLAILQKEQ